MLIETVVEQFNMSIFCLSVHTIISSDFRKLVECKLTPNVRLQIDCVSDCFHYRSFLQQDFNKIVVFQWKVRRTLAFSIHQLAAILGQELTLTDLVPVFDEFVKDLDEVRIGVLKHFADFLKVCTVIN